MDKLKMGDIVARKSYGCDVYFKVVKLEGDSGREAMVTLKGISCRLEADAPLSDLEIQPRQKVQKYRAENEGIVWKGKL